MSKSIFFKTIVVFMFLVFLSKVVIYSQFYNPSTDNGLFSGYNNINTNVNFSTGFSTGFGGSSLFSQSIAPTLNWQTSENFIVEAGTSFTSYSFSGSQSGQMSLNPAFSNNTFNNNFYGNVTYAFGHYKVNENLTISGGTYFESSNFNPDMNPQAFNMNAKGMILGFDYQLNNNASIGAEFNLRSGQSMYNAFNPYSSSPFNTHSPYNNMRNW